VTRIVLFTGKGGVGKTTCAAATAAHVAATGGRVLVTSTDPAHSLADAFDVPLGDRPTSVAPGLDAQQIDAQVRLEEHWRDIRDYLVQLLAWGGIGEVQAEELVLVPGFDELFALLDLHGQAQADRYDLIVVDCAPTAETLRLLALPDALQWYADRLLGPGRRVARVVRPLASRTGGVPVPDDQVFGAAERLQQRLSEVGALLQDADRSSVRLVLNPERLVIREAMRTATSLSLFGYGVDGVIANRLWPDQVTDPWLDGWRQRHADHLAAIHDGFTPTPVLPAPLSDDELVGVERLAAFGRDLYGQHDAMAVLHRGSAIRVDSTDDGHLLTVPLPFANRDDLDLHRRGTDLHVRVGGVKRIVALPAALRRAQITAAGLRDGNLEVRFVAAAPAPAPDTATAAP
jgi:arsenite/tail-anchored protein-transporting ATPase